MAEISVVIPVFNRADLLPRAVASVLKQTGPSFELVVADDGSVDDVAGALSPFASDKRLNILRLGHQGVSAARNFGVAAGSAPMIAFLDSDDEWLPGKLAEQVRRLEADGVSINQTEEIWMRRDGSGSFRRVNPPKHAVKREGDIFLLSLRHCMITPSSVLMTRALFEESGGFDEALPACEDYDLWLRITAKERIGLVRTPYLVRYGGRADQLSAQYPAMDRFRVRALCKWLDARPMDARVAEARNVLREKLRILENGYVKRGNADGVAFCRRLGQQHC